MNSSDEPGFITAHGHYQELLSYQKAEVIYDVTFRFCERFLKRGDRTIDQMVQAARSGKQNIAEGSKAAATSKEMEIKLTNVARASLEELLLDFQPEQHIHSSYCSRRSECVKTSTGSSQCCFHC
jgi:four helix bundle protein